jgi:hypothetical protein
LTAKEFLGTTCGEVTLGLLWFLYPYQNAINGPNTIPEFSFRTASFEALGNAMLLCTIFRELDFQLLASIHSINYSPDTPENLGV